MKLKFDINAFVMIEEMSGGKPLVEILSDELAMTKLTTLRLFVWAGLLHENEKLTLKQAGVLLQEYLQAGAKLADLGMVISKAVEESGLIEKQPEQAEDSNPLTA